MTLAVQQGQERAGDEATASGDKDGHVMFLSVVFWLLRASREVRSASREAGETRKGIA
ncbi:hypothetical protein GCM10010485_65360 [Streptosporangium carneum]